MKNPLDMLKVYKMTNGQSYNKIRNKRAEN